MNISKRILILVLVLVFSISLTACADKSAEDDRKVLDKVTVTLDWTPNTNHTGLFVASDKGYYKEEGLEVTIIQPAGGTAEQLVASNEAQFGVSYQEGVTYARANQVPVVSIAAVIQHNTSGFGSLVEKGILSPKDFEGKRYGGWGSPIEDETIKALMETDGGDFSKVEILTTGSVDFFATSEKNADFSWIFYGWDGIAAETKGIALNYIDLASYDEVFDYYTPVIITSEELIENNRELAEKFMRATAKGYQFAIENPEESALILLNNAPELDKELVLASQEWLSERYQAEAEIWGVQKREVWERYTDWLVERELLDEKIDIDQAFNNDFLVK